MEEEAAEETDELWEEMELILLEASLDKLEATLEADEVMEETLELTVLVVVALLEPVLGGLPEETVASAPRQLSSLLVWIVTGEL